MQPRASCCNSHARQLSRLIVAALLPGFAAASGCREDTESPTAPEPGPAFTASLAHKLTFRQVDAGEFHTCGVTPDHRVYCWGANGYGELGDRTTTDRPRPVRVVGQLALRQVTAGEFHTCGLTPDNLAYCWGNNTWGQLGDGTTTDRLRPVRVAGGLAFHQLSAGVFFTCGVTTAQVAYCWGNNQVGQLGNGTTTDRPRPVRVLGGLAFRQVSSGGDHACGVTADKIAFCWGLNQSGQLGNGTSTGPEECSFGAACSTRPVRVLGGLTVHRVSAGVGHTCALTSGNVAHCWGSNDFGELGNGTSTGPEACGFVACSTRPVRVVGRFAFQSVAAGGLYTCGVTPNGRAYCWGSNVSGELGNGSEEGPESCFFGTINCSARPVPVAGGFRFRPVSAGGSHTCGLTPRNLAYCWGSNSSGQLGNGEDTGFAELTPVLVAPPVP